MSLTKGAGLLAGTPKYVIYSAIDMCAPYFETVQYRKGKDGRPEAYVPQLGEDKELCQFSIELKQKIAEKEFREALRQMVEGLVGKAREAGIIW